ncbi:adenylate/guanylate cyclase domain-containing protein [Sciscionella sediminilitoris]|uniref:adenylate/guanylate cyclase domain-containing protein n=1 Tax=Sciscionella sediminilitoris TaxID=1445613 RepID=UPI00056C9E90|nr:adenylate/guanylate cyclase domain-containing protein [Sciscionella sp. SE31]
MRDRERPDLPLVLRAPFGLGLLGVATSAAGVLTIGLLAWLNGAPERFGRHVGLLATVGMGLTAFAFVVGIGASTALQRRAIGPLREGGELTAVQAAAVYRLPARMMMISGALWLLAVAVMSVLMFSLLAYTDAATGVAFIALGGIATTAYAYLATERLLRPVMSRVLESYQARRGTVLGRLAVTWVLSGGVPLVSVVIALSYTRSSQDERIRVVFVLAGIGVFLGIASTVLLARSVGLPLRRMRTALERIARDDFDARVEVNNTTEIGLMQASVNDLARGLRERERMRDLFERHVGDSVVDHAMSVGASLTGELTEVVALFVDVIGSTELAYALPTEDFVAKLNRLLGGVVAEIDREGGLVNKFEGDATLCIFGAPVHHADPASAALRAARRIRDSVAEAGELDVGIGIAAGRVFAGQLGTRSRLEYTVIGDAVNEAARLTEEAKALPGRVLASESVIEQSSTGERERWSEHARLELRGRADETLCFTSSR